MREYDRDKMASSQLKSQRLEEVYEKCPDIKAIDNDMSRLGADLCKAIILKATEADIQKMADKNQAQQVQRVKLLEEYGFSESYLHDVYKCIKCSDTGFVEGGAKCACFKQKLVAKYYQMSNLGRALKDENFENFKFDYYSTLIDKNIGISPREKMEIIHRYAKQFVNEFKNEPGNLFFHGKVGLGKTFLCSCIAKEVLDKGHTVLYLPATKLFKTIEDARFHRSETEVSDAQINFFYTVELLIIDDLGTEFSTLATQSALFDIVNSRILDRKPTIISSNLSPRELEGHCSDRLVSRFIEHYEIVQFSGEDIRERKKFG